MTDKFENETGYTFQSRISGVSSMYFEDAHDFFTDSNFIDKMIGLSLYTFSIPGIPMFYISSFFKGHQYSLERVSSLEKKVN